ncbi:cyclic-phosphate processing receiver domain-containing protein [Gorillibacterium sp. sgz5001074]|uniref:cyclic-phosphate processing receiver domain-containing protein n=1 Tax=Gorillibacterium sp. sgz5001074 TaxID=3446695 RepID=UPI003F669B30
MEGSIHVYLDDARRKPPGFVLARNGKELLQLLEECEVEVLSMDHDLGWDQPNGLEIVQEMVRRGLYAKEIYLHSSSSMGRMNMYQHLYQYKPKEVKVYLFPVPDEVMRRIAGSGKR